MDAIRAEIDEQANNLPKRLQEGSNKINKISIEILKEMVPQGLPPSAKKQLVKVGEFDIDGIKDFIVCTNDVITEMKYGEKNDKHIVVPINDPHITTKNLEFKIVYKKESLYLTHKLFNYEVSNGVFMKLHQEEEYPLSAGSVFQMGTLNQFIIERYNTGLIAAPGKRANMEDQFFINQDFHLHPQLPVSVHAVFDGHGGEWCAQFVKIRFEKEMRKNLLDPIEGIYGKNRAKFNACVKMALDKTFVNLDEEYQAQMDQIAGKCGSTACVVLIIGNHVFCANIGDSRAVLSKNGVAVNLSLDHKASRPDEVERIRANDGSI